MHVQQELPSGSGTCSSHKPLFQLIMYVRKMWICTGTGM